MEWLNFKGLKARVLTQIKCGELSKKIRNLYIHCTLPSCESFHNSEVSKFGGLSQYLWG